MSFYPILYKRYQYDSISNSVGGMSRYPSFLTLQEGCQQDFPSHTIERDISLSEIDMLTSVINCEIEGHVVIPHAAGAWWYSYYSVREEDILMTLLQCGKKDKLTSLLCCERDGQADIPSLVWQKRLYWHLSYSVGQRYMLIFLLHMIDTNILASLLQCQREFTCWQPYYSVGEKHMFTSLLQCEREGHADIPSLV